MPNVAIVVLASLLKCWDTWNINQCFENRMIHCTIRHILDFDFYDYIQFVLHTIWKWLPFDRVNIVVRMHIAQCFVDWSQVSSNRNQCVQQFLCSNNETVKTVNVEPPLFLITQTFSYSVESAEQALHKFHQRIGDIYLESAIKIINLFLRWTPSFCFEHIALLKCF